MSVRPIPVILAAREACGTDCTEDKSAVLKRHLRLHPHDATSAQIADLFPVEHAEAETERGVA